MGLLLPLHWQTVARLLAVVATDATAVLAADATELAGCGAAFVRAEEASAALDSAVDDVLALSSHPLGVPAAGLPPLAQDYAREVPSYADHYGGPRPGPARIEVRGHLVAPLGGVEPGARVLTTLDPADPLGAAVLLGALAAGASLLLVRNTDPEGVAAAERATATAGFPLEGLTRLA